MILNEDKSMNSAVLNWLL